MKRYDLREHGDSFLPRLVELMKNEIDEDENGIFLFEIGDFTAIQKVADIVKENHWILMNSLKFNEVDWTVVIKKSQDQTPLETITKEE